MVRDSRVLEYDLASQIPCSERWQCLEPGVQRPLASTLPGCYLSGLSTEYTVWQLVVLTAQDRVGARSACDHEPQLQTRQPSGRTGQVTLCEPARARSRAPRIVASNAVRCDGSLADMSNCDHRNLRRKRMFLNRDAVLSAVS